MATWSYVVGRFVLMGDQRAPRSASRLRAAPKRGNPFVEPCGRVPRQGDTVGSGTGNGEAGGEMRHGFGTRGYRCVCSVAGALAAVSACAGPSEAAFPGANGRIAYDIGGSVPGFGTPYHQICIIMRGSYLLRQPNHAGSRALVRPQRHNALAVPGDLGGAGSGRHHPEQSDASEGEVRKGGGVEERMGSYNRVDGVIDGVPLTRRGP